MFYVLGAVEVKSGQFCGILSENITYWYVQEKSASAELNVGANLGITDRLWLRPSLIREYLSAERRGDPFQYKFRASLVYRFQPQPRRPERD
ncbi:hypothetical protein FJZ31_28460 [Candidatus Poribacteria bacterium]|nr:hypothetical protein [Candidatus Poribacteria bacterium]